MMSVSDVTWSQSEQAIARKAFDMAYEREVEALLQQVQQRAGAIAQLDDLWQLHDFLSTQRHEIDGKYDYRYSVLIFVFAQLIKEGWLQVAELEGLDTEKLTKMKLMTRM